MFAHELGHIELGHVRRGLSKAPPKVRHRMEFEADAYASRRGVNAHMGEYLISSLIDNAKMTVGLDPRVAMMPSR